ncbi:MAG: nucleotidyltransferase family protein [Pseudonocardia sp.]
MLSVMELRPGLTVDESVLAGFAARNGIIGLAVFGSVLRPDFTLESGIVILVEFDTSRVPGLFGMAAMERELDEILGRPAGLRTYRDLSQYFRDDVAAQARVVHAA